ncbi:hypothetical protein PMAYCL1PPCAC_01202, partial [Pristionchus mayeri]
SDRKRALEVENEDFNALRTLTFGLIECLQIAMIQLRRRRNGLIPTSLKDEPLDGFDYQHQQSLSSLPYLIVPKEEPFDENRA